MRRQALAALLLPLAATLPGPAWAARQSFDLTLGGHRFTPAELTVPAGQKFILHVTNKGTAPAEFESSDLRREVVVPAGARVVIYVGPLRPGPYVFFDDFDPQTRGRIVAK